MSARRTRCPLSSRKALALCLLSGMSATPVRAGPLAGPLAMIGFGSKGNNAQALAIPNAKRNIRMNVSQYANAALGVLDMQYNKCLERAISGSRFAPTAESCLKKLSENRNQVRAINLKQEAMELASALQQQERRANANIKAEQINLKRNAEIEKAQINKQIASLKRAGQLENAKQIAELEARARNIEKKINKYGGAIVKGTALYAAAAAGNVAGGGIGAFGAGAVRSFAKKTGLDQMATVLVFAAIICAGAIGLVAAAGISVLSIFKKIISMINKIIVTGVMPPITLIKKLIGTTRNYVRATTNNRTMTQINRNVRSVASPTASSISSERTITLVNNNSPTTRSRSSRRSPSTASSSGATTRSPNTASSSGAPTRSLTSSRPRRTPPRR